MAQPATRQSGPGLAPAYAIGDHAIGRRSGQQTAVQGGKTISFRLSPNPPLSLHAAQISEPLLRQLLRPGSDAVTNVGAGNHHVATVGPQAPHKDVGVRLGGVEMADGQPVKLRLAEIVSHPAHHLANISWQVDEAVTMLRRDDEAEVVTVVAPPGNPIQSRYALLRPVEKGGALAALPRAGAAEIADVMRQGRSPASPHTLVARHKRLDDNPLPDVQPKAAAGTTLRRLQHARPRA